MERGVERNVEREVKREVEKDHGAGIRRVRLWGAPASLGRGTSDWRLPSAHSSSQPAMARREKERK
jgi:hypothetical protein